MSKNSKRLIALGVAAIAALGIFDIYDRVASALWRWRFGRTSMVRQRIERMFARFGYVPQRVVDVRDMKHGAYVHLIDQLELERIEHDEKAIAELVSRFAHANPSAEVVMAPVQMLHDHFRTNSALTDRFRLVAQLFNQLERHGAFLNVDLSTAHQHMLNIVHAHLAAVNDLGRQTGRERVEEIRTSQYEATEHWENIIRNNKNRPRFIWSEHRFEAMNN